MRRRRVLKIAAMAVGGYAALLGLTRAAYRSVLYPAPSVGLQDAPVGAEMRRFTASDGEPVQAVIYGQASQPALVFFHGNGETIANTVMLGSQLARRGIRFVAVEYRGYGHSPAKSPSERGLYADAKGVLDTLIAEGTPVERITVWGNSLGTGVAVEMTVQGLASRLILQAPYTSIPNVAQGFAPVLPMRWLMDDRFDNLDKAPAVRVPTLVMHGDRDRIVPHAMGIELAAAIEGAKLITVEGGGHNDLFALELQRLLDAVVDWAKR